MEEQRELTDILTTIQDTFRDILDNATLQLTLAMTADDVDEWDSLTNIQLMIGIEQHYNIRFTAQEIQTFSNVGDLCLAIQTKTAASA